MPGEEGRGGSLFGWHTPLAARRSQHAGAGLIPAALWARNLQAPLPAKPWHMAHMVVGPHPAPNPIWATPTSPTHSHPSALAAPAQMDMRQPDAASVPSWPISADVEALAWDPHTPTQFVVASEDGAVASYDARQARRLLASRPRAASLPGGTASPRELRCRVVPLRLMWQRLMWLRLTWQAPALSWRQLSCVSARLPPSAPACRALARRRSSRWLPTTRRRARCPSAPPSPASWPRHPRIRRWAACAECLFTHFCTFSSWCT